MESNTPKLDLDPTPQALGKPNGESWESGVESRIKALEGAIPAADWMKPVGLSAILAVGISGVGLYLQQQSLNAMVQKNEAELKKIASDQSFSDFTGIQKRRLINRLNTRLDLAQQDLVKYLNEVKRIDSEVPKVSQVRNYYYTMKDGTRVEMLPGEALQQFSRDRQFAWDMARVEKDTVDSCEKELREYTKGL